MPLENTAWPEAADVQTALEAVGIPLRAGVNDTFYEEQIAGVVASLERKTKRQFIADAADTFSDRYFHGSGSGEQIVDDFVELEHVQLRWYNGNSVTDVTTAVGFDSYQFPTNKIIVVSGLPNTHGLGMFSQFPEGRANILVSARWGYSEFIPDDVWIGVRDMAASIMAAYFITDDETGRILSSWIEGSTSEKYKDKMPGESAGWIERYKKLIIDYSRPVNEQLKKNQRQMI